MENPVNVQLDNVKKFMQSVIKDKDLLYIFSPCSIGDFFYNGGLSHAVQARKNKRATVMVINERLKNLGVTYKNFAEILCVSTNALNAIRNYCYTTADYEGDDYIFGHFRVANKRNIWDESLNIIDRYKKDIFSLPLDTPYAAPVVGKISPENEAELLRKYTIDKERTIIISPYVHSTRQLDMTFWEDLAFRLKGKGYVVYTNTDGIKEAPVAGTDAITTNLRELYFLTDKIRCFVGSRNGIFDFLGMTKMKIINICPLPHWLYDPSILYPGCKNRTLYNAMDYMRPLNDYFRQTKMSANVMLYNEHINPADVCFSYEGLLQQALMSIEK